MAHGAGAAGPPTTPARERAPLHLVLASTGLIAVFLYILLIAGNYSGSTNLTTRFLGHALVFATLALWLVAAVRDPRWRPDPRWSVPGLAVLAVIALTVPFSASVRMSLGGLVVGAIGLAAFLLAGVLAASPFFRVRFRLVLILLPVALSVAYLVQVGLAWLELWALVGRTIVPPLRPGWAGLTFGSPNLVATVLLIATPPAVALVLTGAASQRRRLANAVVIAVLSLVAIALTGSRGGVLGLLAAAGIAAGLAVLATGRVPRRVAIAGVAIGTVVALGAIVVVLSRGGQGGEDIRFEYWRTALAIFAAHPVFGGGIDTWAGLKLAEALPFQGTVVVPHAHNVYLWTLAEQGLVGSLAVLAFVALMIWRLLRRARSADPAASLVAIGALSAIGAVAIQSLVDVVTNLPGIVLLLAVIAAYALTDEGPVPAPHGASSVRSVSRARRFAAPVIASLLLVALGVGFLRVDVAASNAELARVVLVLSGSPGDAVDLFDAVYDTDPMPLYDAEAALAAAFDDDSGRAAVRIERAGRFDGLAHHRILEAYSLVASGDHDGAIAAAHTAMDRGWADPGVFLNASRIGEATGDTALATDALVLAAAIAPTTLQDPYWQEPGRAIDYDTLVTSAAQVALERFGPTQEILALAFGGEPEAAQSRLEALGGGGPVLDAIVASVADPAAAIEALRSQLDANPDDWTTAAWLAWIEKGAGRDGDAARHARWAELLQADQAPGLVALPRHIEGDRVPPQFSLYGLYPWAVYREVGSGLLFGPGSVSVVP